MCSRRCGGIPRVASTDMDLDAVRYEVDGHVATVWLHRPHRHNAWTGRMHTQYRYVLSLLDADPDVRAVVVAGTPRHQDPVVQRSAGAIASGGDR